jgi:hypothetical protein
MPQATHSRIMTAVKEGILAVRLGIVQLNASFCVIQSGGKVAEMQ